MNINESNLKFRGLSYGNIPKFIVLHHAEATKCSIYDIHNWHLNNGWAGIGYHYFVRKNGEVWRGRPDNAIGAHVAGHNTNTLGICAEGSYMSETMPQAQKQAIIELCKYLCKKYNINKIYGHREVGSSNCPGPNYPLEEIKKSILSEEIYTNSFIKIDGGGKLTDNKPAINLIIRDFSSDIKFIFGWVDSDPNASWAFALNPLNSNYKKLESNCSHAIYKRNGGNIFTPGANYKIRVQGLNKDRKIVTESTIVLKAPNIIEGQKEESKNLYRVQVGAFRNKNYAENLLEELKEKGYSGFIAE